MKIKKTIHVSMLIVALLVFLAATDPNKIPLPMILIPYLLFALILYRAVSMILRWAFRSGDNSKIKLYSIIITVVMTNFALLKSIGQLTFQDAIISMAIVVISAVYINKFSLDSKTG